MSGLHRWGLIRKSFEKVVYFEKTGDDWIKPQYISFMNDLFIDVIYNMIGGCLRSSQLTEAC